MSSSKLITFGKNVRTKISMVTIIIAAVLAIMVIDTRRKCNVASTSQTDYYSSTKMSEVISIMVLVLCLLIVLWDIAIMSGII